MSYDIKRSVSLYSYQDEYYDKKLDFFVVYHDVNSCKESVVL